MAKLGTTRIYLGSNSRSSSIKGGVVATVDFSEDNLTEDELSYLKLVSHTNFFQLVRTAIYMSEGLNFRDATIKYLKAERDAGKKVN